MRLARVEVLPADDERVGERGVRKVYGPVAALDGLDLDVPAGGLTAVLGPAGCGKTTLLRCVAGFERLDAGERLTARAWRPQL